jgi:hypothetical protein
VLSDCLQSFGSVGSNNYSCSTLTQKLADREPNVRVIFYNDYGYIAKDSKPFATMIANFTLVRSMAMESSSLQSKVDAESVRSSNNRPWRDRI